MTSAVVGSCRHLGWIAAAKGHRLDELPQAQRIFGYGRHGLSRPLPGRRWRLPIAAIELENHRSDERVAYSLWKVLCLRTDLRVVFAFRRHWEESRRLVDAVCRNVIGSLSTGERGRGRGNGAGDRRSGEGETFPWGYFKFWVLDANLGRFEKI